MNKIQLWIARAYLINKGWTAQKLNQMKEEEIINEYRNLKFLKT